MKLTKHLLILTTLLSLGGCGGGGGSSSAVNTSSNTDTPETTIITDGRSWGTPELLETTAGDAFQPQVAFDANGNAIAVWIQYKNNIYSLWANRYVVGNGWGTPELIEHDDLGHTDRPQIAMDASGNAIAVWMQSDGSFYSIWANYYLAGSGWGTPELLENDDSGYAENPDIAFDANGNAIAVWDQSDGNVRSIWANQYIAGSGWGAPALLELDDTGNAYSPKIAFVGAGGNAIAVWHQEFGFGSIFSSSYVAGHGWGTPILLENDDSGDAGYPVITTVGNNDAFITWEQFDGSSNNFWSIDYNAGSGWGKPELLEADTEDSFFRPQFAVDANLNGIAVWEDMDAGVLSIWANRYLEGSGWGTPELLETDNRDIAYASVIAMDSRGNAFAIWNQADGNYSNILVNRFE